MEIRGQGLPTKTKNIGRLQTIMVPQYVGFKIKVLDICTFIFNTYANFIILRPKVSLCPILPNVSLLSDQ